MMDSNWMTIQAPDNSFGDSITLGPGILMGGPLNGVEVNAAEVVAPREPRLYENTGITYIEPSVFEKVSKLTSRVDALERQVNRLAADLGFNEEEFKSMLAGEE